MSEHVPGPEKDNVKEEVAVAASPEMLQRVENNDDGSNVKSQSPCRKNHYTTY